MPDPKPASSIRIAAVADLHFDGRGDASLVPILEQAHHEADVLVLCGDLTHHGLPHEAEALAKSMGSVRMPTIAVLGNHDFHSDQQEEIKRVLLSSPIRVLDGDTIEIHGVGFAGVKGFATGFGTRVLEPWGEPIVKQFVREAVEEALKLESALARIQSKSRVALMHYSPIQETVNGEPLEIFPFLGSSRLEEPLNRYHVAAAFHGHAHHGRPEGKTSTGVPVYNVSLPLLRRLHPNGRPFRVIQLDIASDSDIR